MFTVPPEAVGYAWDEINGAPEVGAMIARMEQEKKLTTSVTHESGLFTDKTVLHLELTADWNKLPTGEKELVQALFLGKTETDTKQIADYYRSTGFQPEKLIKGAIDADLAARPEWSGSAPAMSGPEVAFIAAAIPALDC